jgi:hypothetical protein
MAVELSRAWLPGAELKAEDSSLSIDLCPHITKRCRGNTSEWLVIVRGAVTGSFAQATMKFSVDYLLGRHQPGAVQGFPVLSQRVCGSQDTFKQKKGGPWAASKIQVAVRRAYFGSTTVSITWITPLLAAMSVLMTLALSTVTPPMAATVSSLPWTVLTLPALTSLAITLPGTT